MVARIVVSPDSVSIHIGHTLQLTASPLDSAGKGVPGRSVTWSSSDTGIATITPAGLVTAKTYGTVLLTARVDTISGIASIVVLMPVTGTYTQPDTATLVPGGQLQLTAVVQGPGDTPLSDRIVTWSSTIPANASVSPSGRITAGSAGSAVIIDSSEGVSSSGTRVLVTQPVFTRLISGNAADGTCGITVTQELFCWGDNSTGQLGNGTYTNLRGPIGPVPWPTGIVNIASISDAAMTDYVTCAVTTSYGPPTALCWGSGDHFRLGNNSTDDIDVPGFVQTSLSFRQVTASTSHTCALAADSSGYCWGRVYGGAPTPVMPGVTFRWIGAGYDYTCGLSADSLAYCWGLNSDGVLGNDTASAGEVAGGLKFASLAAGALHVCGIASDSSAYCWGQGAWGQLGTGDTIDAHVPTPVLGGLRLQSITAGTAHTCALAVQGATYCWGQDDEGQLGVTNAVGSCRSTPCSTTPSPVTGGFLFAQIVAGEVHTCGLTLSGVAYCWGGNGSGQLGDGTVVGHTPPARVIGQP
ncbi:MAG TPA: Ig-like domain-containing protein [Gemmatimonadales bacterium]|nr:Ig-like domain-containing protein [Gemmatimonadales bacterium]